MHLSFPARGCFKRTTRYTKKNQVKLNAKETGRGKSSNTNLQVCYLGKIDDKEEKKERKKGREKERRTGKVPSSPPTGSQMGLYQSGNIIPSRFPILFPTDSKSPRGCTCCRPVLTHGGGKKNGDVLIDPLLFLAGVV